MPTNLYAIRTRVFYNTLVQVMPRKKSFDLDKVYVSEPVKKQKHFPSRRHLVNRKHVSFSKTLSQKSLTQMQYVIGLPRSGEIGDSDLSDIEELEGTPQGQHVIPPLEMQKEEFEGRRKSKRSKRTAEVADSDNDDSDYENVAKDRKRVKRSSKGLDLTVDEWEDHSEKAPSKSGKAKQAVKRSDKFPKRNPNHTIMTEEQRSKNQSLTQMQVNGRPFVSSGKVAFLVDIPDEIPPQSAQNPSKRKRKGGKPSMALSHDTLQHDIERKASPDLDEILDKDQNEPVLIHSASEIGKPTNSFSAMPPPQTPKRTRLSEIPSSQSPAATPLSTRSIRSMHSRCRSPLQERSSNSPSIHNTSSRSRRSVRFELDNLPNTQTQAGDSKLWQKSNICVSGDLQPMAGLPIQQIATKCPSAESNGIPAEDARPAFVLERIQKKNHDELFPSLQSNKDIFQENEVIVTPRVVDSPTPHTSVPNSHSSGSDESNLLDFQHDRRIISSAQPKADISASHEPDVCEAGNISQADSASAQLLSDMWEYTQRYNATIGEEVAANEDHMMPSQRSHVGLQRSAKVLDESTLSPSQASTVDITQASSLSNHGKQQTLQLSSPQLPPLPNRSSPPMYTSSAVQAVAYSTQVPDTPTTDRFVQVPSSPLLPPPSSFSVSWPSGAENGPFRRPPSVSQLLPESLLRWDIPAPPGSIPSQAGD